jgi:regulator of protease activity HflC (stomatin/prohibitin superfamily)
MRQRQALHMMRQVGAFGTGPVSRPLHPGRWVTVSQWEQALLFRHGRLDTVLGPGRHRRWRRGFTVNPIDTRPWVLVVPTQEVPTADGATVKITVAGQARIADPVAYVTASRSAEQSLYLAVQVALREQLAATTIEDLLASRGDVGSRLAGAVRGVGTLGITIDQLEIKDIIPSSDLKKAQAEVLVARAQGLAALERARGETAALRSLANAARLAADNPSLVHLRLLQQLEASTGHTVVIGTSPLGTSPLGTAPPVDH